MFQWNRYSEAYLLWSMQPTGNWWIRFRIKSGDYIYSNLLIVLKISYVMIIKLFWFLQVVICQNSAASRGMVQGTLLHEMIHMFDYCRNKLDLKNIDHLACTEIRAANIGHCSFLGSMFQGYSSPFNIKATHQVKYRWEVGFIHWNDVL